ncbi:hypothetical protein BGX23_005100, partial [Mortierella sp. AD031]
MPMSLLISAPSPNPAVSKFAQDQSTCQAVNADLHRRDHDFKVGDQVLLSLKNVTLPADLARTIHKPVKPQSPEAYTDAIDTDACHNFIDNQEEYYAIFNI